MTCPNCGEALRERERSGIEVDVCPACRGIWLDRGELDKLIDRESAYYGDDDDDWGRERPADRDRDGNRRREVEYVRERGRGDRGSYPPAQHKKKGFFQTMVESFSEGGGGGMED
jgi:Zn-finger nucleic acid-binding protein